MIKELKYLWKICWGFSTTELYAYPFLLTGLVLTTFLLKCHQNQPSWQELPLPPGLLDSILVESSAPNQGFSIDPNTISKDSLLLWGLPEFLVVNWTKYRQAGGRFRSVSEVRKLYGMSDSIWVVLQDCLRVKENPRPVKSVSSRNVNSTKTMEKRDINLADSMELKAVYGIGPVLSRRIIKYRNLLGGFYDMTQLSEVYGLDSTVIVRLNQRYTVKPDYQYHKLKINSLDYRSLVRHPYLTPVQVKAILAYRTQHGVFLSPDQLKEVHLIDDSTYIKLYPYIDF